MRIFFFIRVLSNSRPRIPEAYFPKKSRNMREIPPFEFESFVGLHTQKKGGKSRIENGPRVKSRLISYAALEPYIKKVPHPALHVDRSYVDHSLPSSLSEPHPLLCTVLLHSAPTHTSSSTNDHAVTMDKSAIHKWHICARSSAHVVHPRGCCRETARYSRGAFFFYAISSS